MGRKRISLVSNAAYVTEGKASVPNIRQGKGHVNDARDSLYLTPRDVWPCREDAYDWVSSITRPCIHFRDHAKMLSLEVLICFWS